ncbi:MAG: RNA polymerase sigma factor FliA [Gammaproteobacteria bacterium]|nr:RNA polymerase sigma factor FliA [Gammaproteobacteria bacterium]NND55242.1 RNA polymerase sigma factor FliA [Gammaproteobacteria bacterium]
MSLADEYQVSGGVSADDLVEQYAPLVKKVALHLLARLPHGTELDDLIQVGLIALLEAARNYNASKGASFETYARIRLRGAMLDEVRAADWAPRSVYKKQRDLVTATREVENRTGQEATPAEVAELLEVDLDEYHDILADASSAKFFSLNQMMDDTEYDPAAPPSQQNNPSQELQKSEFFASVADAIQELPEREGLVMSLYYVEELNLKEIGAVLGVSESRVSQIHSQAVVRLRARLGEEWGAADNVE